MSGRYVVRQASDGQWAIYDLEGRQEVTRRPVRSEAVMFAECMERHGRVWR